MSLAFYGITCSVCDFRSSHSYGIRYAYEGPPDQEPELSPAWCHTCDQIITTCIPYTHKSAELAIGDQQRVINQNRGIFRRFSKARQQETHEAKEELKAIYQRIQHFEEVPFKPRCLECGGHDVFPFDPPDVDYDEVEKLDIEHSCGGYLLISKRGRLMFRDRPTVVFDKDGEVVNDERRNQQ